MKGSLTTSKLPTIPSPIRGSFLALAETFPRGFRESDQRSRTTRPRRPGRRSISTAPARVARRFRNQRREQRRRVGEPAPAGRLAVDDQGVSDSDEYVQRRIGRGFGAVVLVQTKSGTNRWHGDVTTFHAGQLVDARERVRAHQARQPARSDGGTAGFPIIRTGCSDSPASTGRASGAQTYARDIPAAERADAAVDPRERHAAEPRIHRVDARAIPDVAPERPAQQSHICQTPRGYQPAGRGSLSSAASDGSAAGHASRAGTSSRTRFSIRTT